MPPAGRGRPLCTVGVALGCMFFFLPVGVWCPFAVWLWGWGCDCCVGLLVVFFPNGPAGSMCSQVQSWCRAAPLSRAPFIVTGDQAPIDPLRGRVTKPRFCDRVSALRSCGAAPGLCLVARCCLLGCLVVVVVLRFLCVAVVGRACALGGCSGSAPRVVGGCCCCFCFFVPFFVFLFFCVLLLLVCVLVVTRVSSWGGCSAACVRATSRVGVVSCLCPCGDLSLWASVQLHFGCVVVETFPN